MHHVQVAVRTPALLVARPVLEAARTGLGVVLGFRKDSALEARTGSDKLEHGSRRVNTRDGPVRKRTERIERHLRPSLVAFALLQREDIRIEPRGTHHRKDFAVARIDRHQGALHAIRDGRLGDLLQLEIYRRYQVKARNRRLPLHCPRRTHLAARGIHFHELHPVLSAELHVIFLLESLLPDTVTLGIPFVRRLLQLFFGNFTRVAKHMRSERPVRIIASGFGKRHHSRKFGGMFLYHGHLFGRSIFQNMDGPVLYPARPLEGRIERQRIEHAHAVLVLDSQKQVEHGIAAFLLARQMQRLQRDLEARTVAHQDFAVAVIDKPAFRDQLHTAQAVLLGTLEILVVMGVLQRIEANQ